MKGQEHEAYRERLDLYADGALASDARHEVEAHVAGCASCRTELADLRSLHGLMRAARVEVRPGFAELVMSGVTADADRRSAQPWRLAVALFLVTAGLATALAAVAGAAGGFSLVAAVADFASTSLLTGAGLLSASWRGVGMAVGSWITASVPNLLLSLVAVVGVNVLLLRLLRRRLAPAAARRDRRS